MADESRDGESVDEVSRIDTIKHRLKDAGQKVGAASKKAAQKTGEIGSAIVESSVAQDIAAGAKKVGTDVKVASARVSDSVDKKREEFKERREAAKVARDEAAVAAHAALHAAAAGHDDVPDSSDYPTTPAASAARTAARARPTRAERRG